MGLRARQGFSMILVLRDRFSVIQGALASIFFLRVVFFFLQPAEALQQVVRIGGAARHIDIHWHEGVHAGHDAVDVAVEVSGDGAGAHGNNIFGISHLIVGSLNSNAPKPSFVTSICVRPNVVVGRLLVILSPPQVPLGNI